MEVGGWRLEVGGWRLEVGGWRLELILGIERMLPQIEQLILLYLCGSVCIRGSTISAITAGYIAIEVASTCVSPGFTGTAGPAGHPSSVVR